MFRWRIPQNPVSPGMRTLQNPLFRRTKLAMTSRLVKFSYFSPILANETLSFPILCWSFNHYRGWSKILNPTGIFPFFAPYYLLTDILCSIYIFWVAEETRQKGRSKVPGMLEILLQICFGQSIHETFELNRKWSKGVMWREKYERGNCVWTGPGMCSSDTVFVILELH